MRVLIVGAGPAGLTAAAELARRGLVPTLIERREGPSDHSRAVGVTPRSLALLAPSGAAAAILAEAAPLERLLIHIDGRLALDAPARSDRTAHPHIVALPQDRTEAALIDALARAGGGVRWGLALESLTDEGARAVARFSDGSEAAFDHVIGADGTRSAVREAAGIGFDGVDLAEDWSIADVDAEGWPHPRAFAVALGPPGVVSVVAPLGGARCRVVANRPDALAALSLPLRVAAVRRSGRFRIAVRQADSYSRGRIHLAGDAAHCHSPVGGRGMNLGIADACDLARRLVEGGLGGYHAARHPEGRRTIALTERARRMMTAEDAPTRLLRGAFFALADAVGPLKRRFGRGGVEA